MKTLPNYLLTFALILPLLGAMPDSAHSVGWTKGAYVVAPFPHFKVKSNGANYTQMDTPALGFYFDIQVELHGDGRKVKNFNTSPKMKIKIPTYDDYDIDLSSFGPSKTYKIFKRPENVSKVFKTQVIPSVTYANTMVAACNLLANKLRNDGLTNQQIFSQDRSLDLTVKTWINVDWTVGTSPNAGGFGGPQAVSVPLTCSKKGGPVVNGANDFQSKMSVTKAELSLPGRFGSLQNRDCPLTVPFKAKIFGTSSGQVKYRMRTASGKITGNYTMQLQNSNGGGSGEYTINVPVPLPIVNNGGGGSGGGLQGGAADELMAEPHNNDGVIPTNGIPSGPGNIADKPTASNLHKESFRIETITPNRVVSKYTGYIIRCNSKVNPTFSGGVEGLQKNPDGGDPPKPPGGYAANLGKADLMATPLGIVIAGSLQKWGTSATVNNGAAVAQKGVGRGGNMCRFNNTRFRPFNKGNVASGNFMMRVYRDKQAVHSTNLNLAAHKGLPANAGWYSFNIDLKQGWNQVEVALDTNSQVDEMDENNNRYKIRINVPFKCTKDAPGNYKAPSKPGSNRPRFPRRPGSLKLPTGGDPVPLILKTK